MTTSRSLEEQLILEHFGKRLRELRSSKELTQEDLAIRAGFSRSYYTEIETGKRNVSLLNLYRLAECLNVSPSALLTFKLE
jgi:transcriptional regulator with XRE-family HTH domain